MAVDFGLFGLVEDAGGFVGHDEVADSVVDDEGTGSVDKRLDGFDAASIFEEVAGAVDVDAEVEIWVGG